MENSPQAKTLSDCIMELDNIRSIISHIVGLFRMAAKDDNPDTFESVDLEWLAKGAGVQFYSTVTPKKKRGRKPGTKITRTNLRGILSPDQTADYLGVSKMTVYRWSKKLADFPKRVVLDRGSTGWIKSELDAFVESRKKGVAA